LVLQVAEIPSVKRADKLIAGSATTRDEFIVNYGVNLENVSIVPHGVDTDFFRPRDSSINIRRNLGIKHDERVILFVGFITRRKGLETLVKALPFIRPVPRLIILGKWRSEAYRKEVVTRLHPYEHQVIETGFAPDEEMPGYYSMADVYVSSSYLEGFGLPLAESLACETPVVALETGSVAEVVGEGGLLLKENNPELLAEAISTILQDDQRRITMGKIGREHIINEFSLAAMLRKTLEVYTGTQ
jgi:glycosyltransferase involved in cell wall biosynthesis